MLTMEAHGLVDKNKRASHQGDGLTEAEPELGLAMSWLPQGLFRWAYR